MPPKKPSALVRETTNTSEGLPREGRVKRNQNYREPQEESSVATSSVSQPFDIESLDFESLKKYRSVMHLPSTYPQVLPQDRLSEAPGRFTRVEKQEELAASVKRHWNSTQVKESEVITMFMYSLKNQDKTFKLRFTEGPRS